MKFKPYKNLYNLNKLPKEQFEYFASRVDCIARSEVFISWIVDRGAKSFIVVPDGKVLNYYFELKSIRKTLIDLGNEMNSNWKGYIQTYDIKKKDLILKTKKLSSRLNNKNKQIIRQDYNDYLQSAYNFCDYLWGAWSVIYIDEPEIIMKYPEKVDIIVSIDRPIEYMKMEKDLFILSDNQLVKKYGWLCIYNPFENVCNEKYFLNLRKKLHRKKINAHFKNFTKSKIKFTNFISTVKDKKLKKKIEIVHEFAWLKTDRVDVWKKVMFYVQPFYRYLSKQLGISLRDSTNLTTQEIFNYLDKNKRPQLNDLAKRSKGFWAYYYKLGKIYFIPNVKQDIYFKKITAYQKNALIKGIIACSGKVRGIAKIISTEKDLKKVTSKDIFIAKFTYPVFTPYMLKARAVVTDDGGLTSHAAIIAREYKKPCIVGTQFATKMFKDGDVVEVDANKGIIKKIK